MATEIETRVLAALSAVEVPPETAAVIEGWGTEAITVTCDVALGDYPGIERRVRTNAVALLGWMAHPQAHETVAMLLNDPNPNVAARALRAAGRQGDASHVAAIAGTLRRPELTAVLAAEAVDALSKIGSAEAVAALATYQQASEAQLPHRGSEVVGTYLRRHRERHQTG